MLAKLPLRLAAHAAARSVVVRGLHVERRLGELGIALPALGTPKGSYALTSRTGNLLFLSGHLPIPTDGALIVGKVGEALTPEEANAAARWCALNIISTLKAEVGDLDKIKKIHKLVGFVNCVDTFDKQPAVINGASDLFVDVFGDKGTHARSAVGTNALPLNVPVEIEAIVEVED
mmetsp:Transcript_36570/g.117280  ORF Transcript_36570/g.117280 Transcript_36570/m.117280 type:complete len:176 (+) Transcript_36570:54-581(+)